MVYIKCPAYFEQFSETVHRVLPEDVEAIWHKECEDTSDDDED